MIRCFKCSVRTPNLGLRDLEQASFLEQMVSLVTVGAQTVISDADLAVNINGFVAAIAGLQIGHHAHERQLGVLQDIDPSVSKQASIKAKQVLVGGHRDPVPDFAASLI